MRASSSSLSTLSTVWLLLVSVLSLLLTTTTVSAQAMSGCQRCAQYGDCSQAFHGGYGKYCANWQDPYANYNSKPCCCPNNLQCKVSQFKCLCSKNRSYSNTPVYNSGSGSHLSGFVSLCLFLLCCCCAGACCTPQTRAKSVSGTYQAVATAPPPPYNPNSKLGDPVTAYPVHSYGSTDVRSSAFAGAAGGVVSGALAGGLIGNLMAQPRYHHDGYGNQDWGGGGDIVGDSGDWGGGGGDIVGDSGDWGGDIGGDS